MTRLVAESFVGRAGLHDVTFLSQDAAGFPSVLSNLEGAQNCSVM